MADYIIHCTIAAKNPQQAVKRMLKDPESVTYNVTHRWVDIKTPGKGGERRLEQLPAIFTQEPRVKDEPTDST